MQTLERAAGILYPYRTVTCHDAIPYHITSYHIILYYNYYKYFSRVRNLYCLALKRHLLQRQLMWGDIIFLVNYTGTYPEFSKRGVHICKYFELHPVKKIPVLTIKAYPLNNFCSHFKNLYQSRLWDLDQQQGRT